jgi:tetratricopeptide (TPR) repeat protein
VIRTALLLLLLLPSTAQADEDAPGPEALDARGRMAEAMYLESGAGDYEAAVAVYRALLERGDALDERTAAEACMRLGLAHERLEQVAEAEAAYDRILRKYPNTSWSNDAQQRLRSLDEDRKRVSKLPVRWTFDDDLGGLFHARNRTQKGRLTWEPEADGPQAPGVAAWQTYVTGGEDDLTVVGFDPTLLLQGELSLRLRVRNFPAHLVFFLVDAAGGRYASATSVVRPEEGWRTVSLGPADFVDRSRAPGESGFQAQAGITYLMIQDVTGYSSTDRGENVLLLDDLEVR